MEEKDTVILNSLSSDRKSLIGFHRFLNNDKVQKDKLIDLITSHCGKQVAGRDLLCIQDTVEYNYQHHANRIKSGELGPVTKEPGIGYFAHPMLAIDSENEICLGFGALKLWHRDFDKQDKHERKYRSLPIEEKESYRWIESIEQTKKNLRLARHITVLADREGDIYQLWERSPDEKTDLLIRCRTDRKLYGEEQSLFQHIDHSNAVGSYVLDVRENKKVGRSKHKALLVLKLATVKLKRPKLTDGQEYVEVNVVEVREDESTIKEGEPPVHWRLLTTLKVEDFDQGKEVVRKYGMRWQIEQLFRISKHQGLNIEASQMETGHGLMNLGVLALHASMKILQLTQAREKGESVNASITFSTQQVALMKVLVPRYEGTTTKLKNPFRQGTLAWTSWIIARLGGWKGYSSHSPPGPITIFRGLVKFDQLFEGWSLSIEDV